MLVQHTRFKVIAPRTSIVRQGDEVAGAVLVDSGSIRVYYLDTQGREGTLYWVAAGEACILALNAMFAELPYPAWAESDDLPTRYAVIPSRVYRELFQHEPSIQRFTFDILSRRVHEMMRLVEQSATKSLEQRIAALILETCTDKGVLQTTQERLAHHVGTAREVIVRILRNFRAQDLIETRRGMIQVLDREALARVAQPARDF